MLVGAQLRRFREAGGITRENAGYAILEPGASFTWTSFGFTVTSTFYDVTDHSRLLWGGTGEGITGVHEWLFSETSDGVHVVTNESFDGEPVEADRGGMQTLLDASLQSWLAHLKAAAEAKA
ncbi:MAG: Shy6-polyketide cyclase [Actinomycetia bacterium]|nr:Shy6-polyketide cyclase [Actinomycetes bacterium]